MFVDSSASGWRKRGVEVQDAGNQWRVDISWRGRRRDTGRNPFTLTVHPNQEELAAGRPMSKDKEDQWTKIVHWWPTF